ncbi:MAG: hypothetical protein JW730_13165 [Anaerolineales bacterium]|nr:hypothetical protein [Anaerolineales bacterium]
MRFLRIFFAATCAVLFVISSVLVLLLFNIERKAFSSETYQQAFENQGLYQRMPAILGTTLTTYIAENGSAVPFLQVLTAEDWQNSITLLIPPEELKQMGNHALDATFDYLNGRTNSATISLLPVKAHLAGEAGLQIVLQILRRQPACTTEQLTQMALGLFGGQVVLCNPPEEALGLMMPFVQTQLQSMVAVFPNEVTLIPGTASDTPDDPRLKLNAVRSAIKLTPLIPAILLFGIAVFAVRSLVDWLTWWGWSFMFAGGASVLVGLFGSPLVGGILGFVIQNQGARLIPPILASSIAETAGAVAGEMLTPVVIQGFIPGLIGLGMVIAATLQARSEKSRAGSLM